MRGGKGKGEEGRGGKGSEGREREVRGDLVLME